MGLTAQKKTRKEEGNWFEKKSSRGEARSGAGDPRWGVPCWSVTVTRKDEEEGVGSPEGPTYSVSWNA